MFNNLLSLTYLTKNNINKVGIIKNKLVIILSMFIYFQTSAQILLPNITPVIENFDGMGSTLNLPSNWRMSPQSGGGSPTWATGLTSTTQQASSGSPTTGGRYNWGLSGSTNERSIGFMTSGSYSSPNSVMVFYQNTNAASLTTLDISFNVERYRINTSSCQLEFYYSLDGTTWVSVPAGDITSGTFATGVSAYTFVTPQSVSRTLSITGLNIINGGSIYLRWNFNTTGSNSQGLGLDDVSVTPTFAVSCTSSTQPTTQATNLTFTNISCTSFTINWFVGDGSNHLVVISSSPIVSNPIDNIFYISNTIYGLGATIAAGVFTIYNGVGSTVNITGLTSNTTYYIKIFEFNGNGCPDSGENYLTVTPLSGSQLTSTCISTCAELTGILVDACGSSEGTDELVTFVTGSTPVDMSNLSITFALAGTWCNAGCGGNTWVTNPTFVASLNTTANCGFPLFFEANPLPANSQVVVFTSNVPTYAFDFSGACASVPLYAVFANSSNTTGRFINYNSSCLTRTVTASFGGSCSDNVTYDRCLLSNTDGAFVEYDALGNATYKNDGTCTPTTIVMSINVFILSVENNILNWETEGEINNNYFTVLSSKDGIKFDEVILIKSLGDGNHNYTFKDEKKNDIVYYKIKQTNFDGNYSFSNIVSVKNCIIFSKLINDIRLLEESLSFSIFSGSLVIIDILNVSGQLLFTEKYPIDKTNIVIPISNVPQGVYILRAISDDKIEYVKFLK